MALSRVAKQQQEKGLPKALDADDSDADGVSSEDASANEAEGNSGWADCIAKVLNTSKPKKKKTLVLSRAKKFKVGDKAKTTTVGYGFEVEGEQKEEEKPIKEEIEQLKRRKNVPLELRAKPSWKDMERERTLRKVATRGVVQLFNAVRIQQKDIQKQLVEAGPLDSRKDAVLNNINKRKFLDVLMSGNRAKSEAIDNSVKNETLKEESSDEDCDANTAKGTQRKRKSEWNVLQEDFMTNKKNKHWDEDDDDEEAEQASEESGDE